MIFVITASFVASVILYLTFAVGISLSIQSTFKVTVTLFPASSTNSITRFELFSNLNLNILFSYSTKYASSVNGLTFLSNLIVDITFSFVAEVISYSTLAVGIVLSIQSTLAVILFGIPYPPTYSNVNSPFSVNVYVLLPLLFVILIYASSSSVTNVTTTFLFVIVSILYISFTFKVSLIQLTFAVAVPLFPASSSNSNVNSPFSLNVYVLLPLLFKIVIFSLAFKVTVTGSNVIFFVLYSSSTIGASLSIQSMSILAFPLLPTLSSNSKQCFEFFSKTIV